MPTLTKYFLRGILVLIPMLVTTYAVWWLVSELGPLFHWVGEVVGGATGDGLQYVLGIAVSLALITLLGLIASNYVGARVVSWIEHVVDRVPLIKLLHGSVKDLLGAFVGDKKSFDCPVLVSLSGDGQTKVAGFVTREDLDFLGIEDHVAVYLPQSYNFAGNLIIVPKDRVKILEAPSSDVMAFLVSGGVSSRKPDQPVAPLPTEGS